ncbi:toll/interleukin-1 receptor domain-containing protein [Nodosilinea sp. PGN35]|uniref:toll/interleukin-1 receptor domain-containing protein n=1 Tax=Nodosilinea sp. PGN35 TaxID=3020489 RepID=UPI0023B2BBBB|nr:toll/interleukin-1 receptor domain-containing protein [Nodosilinea sp. TSF1-S3]MDF0367016.1 toll/interleukin-1 receptor domain-containing protein [Nodosilinea sp. TSF1-S3]
MHFDRDIFISYTHVDNKPLAEGQDGWIATFHRGLEIRLEQLRGTSVDIWRDIKLQGNDALDESIFKQFPNLALLVAVLSPRYLQSDWCSRELACFLESAEARGGVNVCGTTRLFKVVKTYLETDRHPSGLRDLLGYAFYEMDAAGRPREFNKIYGPESERKFWAKLEDLAYDIHQTLKVLDALPDPDGAAVAAGSVPELTSFAPGKVIYLAETTPDLSVERERIRRELEQAGHRVLPDQPLPNPPNFDPVVCGHLAQAALSVHLLSPYATVANPAQPLTQQEIYRQLGMARTRDQIELAKHCGQTRPDFGRILWLPPDATLASLEDWVLALQNEPDFVSTNLESLKDIIRDRLNPTAISTFDLPQDGTTQIYLDCDKRDVDSGELDPLTEWLEKHFVVTLPEFEDNGLSQSEALIKQCEAVLIYYGYAGSSWLNRRLRALQKNANYNRQRPLRAKAVYVAGPVNPTKQNLQIDSWPIEVITGINGFNPDLLNVFLEQLA